jgi:hypothetical protein
MGQIMDEPTLHIRYDGFSHDIPLDELDINNLSTADEVRMAAAQYLDVGLDRLEPYVIEKHRNGNITVRPEAVFGD